MSEVIAEYLVHDRNPNKKAEEIALGLTVGSWTNLPELEKKQLLKHKGRVVSVEAVAEVEEKAILKIAYPVANFTPDIPAILTTVFGKLSLDGKIKLLDLQFESSFKLHFPGPRYGITGIRNKLGILDRPLLMSIFKGVLGRDMNFLIQQLREQALGGIDIVKDDEILFENTLTPLEKRIIEGKKVLHEVYESTGKRTLYAVNLSGRTSELKEKARRAAELGADLLLVNVFSYGLDALQEIREDDEVGLPIMAHPAFSGALGASPAYGVSYSLLLGKLLRYVGADLSLFPSPYGTVALAKEEALSISRELTIPDIFEASFPVPSAGIHPGLVSLLIHDFGKDCVINAGGGIHGHPDGPQGGGRAFLQAIERTLQGLPLIENNNIQHSELKKAIDLWGSVEVKT